MLSIAAAASQRRIASPAFQVCYTSKCSCFWGINQTLSRSSGQLSFLLLSHCSKETKLTSSLPQECCCGSICKWLITGKEQDKTVPLGDEAPVDAPGVSEVLRWYSVFLSLFACLSRIWMWGAAWRYEWERSAALGSGDEVTDPSVSMARSARLCLWVAWIFLPVRGTRCSLVKDVTNFRPTAHWSGF